MARLRDNIVGQGEVLVAMESMLVRLIAEAIHGNRDGLCRIDMNTLAQEHYAAALTGAPPGYVGSK